MNIEGKCPYCHSNKDLHLIEEADRLSVMGSKRYYVVCYICLARGPVGMRAEEALNSFNDKNKTNITNLYTIELESTIKRLLDFIENKTTCKDSKGMKKIIASSRKILSSNHNRSKNRYAKSIH